MLRFPPSHSSSQSVPCSGACALKAPKNYCSDAMLGLRAFKDHYSSGCYWRKRGCGILRH